MKKVTMDEFYAEMNPRNVSPTIVSAFHPENGYTVEWRSATPARLLVGVSQSGNGSMQNKSFGINEETLKRVPIVSQARRTRRM